MEHLLAVLGFTSPLELFGAVTALGGIWLQARNRVSGWPVGLLSIVAYAVVFYDARLYADTLLQGFYFVTSLAGWYEWLRGGAQHTELPVTRLTGPQRWLVLAGIGAASLALGWFFASFTNASRPFLDSLCAGGSVVAQLLLMRRKLDNWALWIAVDALSVGLYLSKALYVTAGLYALLCVIAWRGLVDWRRVEGTARAV